MAIFFIFKSPFLLARKLQGICHLREKWEGSDERKSFENQLLWRKITEVYSLDWNPEKNEAFRDVDSTKWSYSIVWGVEKLGVKIVK
jgi:hypothetical protein